MFAPKEAYGSSKYLFLIQTIHRTSMRNAIINLVALQRNKNVSIIVVIALALALGFLLGS